MSYREFFLEHFVLRVSQSSTVQTAPDLVVQERIYQCGKNMCIYMFVCLSKGHSCNNIHVNSLYFVKLDSLFLFFFVLFLFLRQGFSVAMEPVLELAL